ncbi:MAG: urea ABC transporter permease subunit UrtB [Desulforhopalus sp.]|nr:urea ABC transporter permease subunit UrtB [Desulforhopalus sp.]
MKKTPRSISRLLPTLLLLLLALFPETCLATAEEGFSEGVVLLATKGFAQKSEGAEKIAASGDQRAGKILRACLDGQLYLTREGQNLVYGTAEGDNLQVSDALTGAPLSVMNAGQLTKVTINNQLRGQLKTLLARLSLKNPDPAIRLAGVREMFADITPETAKVLDDLRQSEQDQRVREALQTALALAGVRGNDPTERKKGLADLAGSLDPEVRNELTRLIAEEKDPAALREAKRSLAKIEDSLSWYAKLETLFFGLSLGSVLVLAAIGLAITFGVIGVINMAHGELIMIGAYTAYVMQQLLPQSIGLALALSIPAAFIVAALVGIAIERSVIRFLYGRPLETLLATFGISLILQQAVRSIFSPLNRSVVTPAWMSGSIAINPVLSFTSNRLVIFVFAMLVFAGLFLLLKKSSLGLQVRAVSQNRAMARAMGVRASRVDALTFGLGSGVAGIAGVALSQLTNVGPNLGQSYIVDSFMVVVFGGVGNLWGTLVGGLALGVANKFLEPWSGAVLAKIVILVLIILFIQKRPQGLFPQRGRAAE